MRLLVLLTFLALSFSVSAQKTEGIIFEDKSFDELLALAKDQNKIIFLDAYASWCGPCKMMASKVFPQANVGKVFNEKFVNAKIDMEKGEGPELAKRYSVQAYPTYLFINGDGNLVHKALGYIPAEDFIALAEDATSDNSLLALDNRYKAGERSSEFVLNYIEILTNAYETEKADGIVGDYLNSIDKAAWANEDNLDIIMSNPGKLGGERFNFIIENADIIKKSGAASELVGLIQNTVISNYMSTNKMRKLPEVEAIQMEHEKYAAPLASQLTENYAMEYAKRMNPKEFPALAVAYYNKYPSDSSSELNQVAWHFYENVEDQNMLKYALGWAMNSVRLDKQYMNMDTLAWLYKKLGMDKQARKIAEEAIELAKAEGIDFSSTSPILE